MYKSIEGYSVILLIVAHPDDEIMFFSPVLERLAAKRVDIHILSLSNGNADGLGALRTKEFEKCASVFGISKNNVEVFDHPNLQDGMKNIWGDDLIAQIVSSKVLQSRADLVNPNIV